LATTTSGVAEIAPSEGEEAKHVTVSGIGRLRVDVQRLIGSTAAVVYTLQNGQIAHESYSGRHNEDKWSRQVDAQTQYKGELISDHFC
jgi:hypothetical protein